MNQLQEKILTIMEEIDKICSRENITYYMVGGTMLGAIRHKGFIPWDDDIDISMPRKDFERFNSIKKDLLPEWMEIIPPGGGPVNMGYTKVVDKTTTIVEDYKGVRVGGVFIDVFPLDGIGDSFEDSVKQLRRIKIRTFMLRANQGLSNTDSLIRKAVGLAARVFPKNFLYRRYYSLATSRDYYDCQFVANTVGVYEIKELTARSVYGEPRRYMFEGKEFYGVEKPDEFLKGLYGDYMKLPPEEKRVSQHGVLHLDLDKPYRDYLRERKENT